MYILRSISRPDQLYVGVTSNLAQRLEYHNTGRCLYTSKFRPWRIIHKEQFAEGAAALKRERQIKGWSRAKKEALISGDRNALSRLARRRVR